MKKDEEDKLIKGIRERLENYSEPIPDELWSSLERELDNRPKVHPHTIFRMIVAASFLLIAVTSLTLWLLKEPVGEYMPEVASVSRSGEEQKQQTDFEPQPMLPSPSGSSRPLKNVAYLNKKKGEKAVVQEKKETSEDKIAEKVNTVPEKERKVRKDENVEIQRRNARALASLNKKDYKKWTIGVSYGNSPSMENSGMPGFSSLDIGGNMNAMSMSPAYGEGNCSEEGMKKVIPFKKVLANNIGKQPKTSVKHKTPVTAGVSFRYGLSRNFAVETGITYTMLSSELRSGSENDFYLEEYKLHYIGIPLKGNWMFLNRKYFTLYLSAGGAMEKSVAGKYKITYVTSGEPDEYWNENVKPLQWSVAAAIGAQFNATDHFGIYVEPGIVHYFDDGSNVETIRKEKPTNFNLQLGLRWTY